MTRRMRNYPYPALALLYAVFGEDPDPDLDRAIMDNGSYAFLAETVFPEVFLTLTPRERSTICLRFGLYETPDRHSLDQIGAIQGVTRERIRQVLAKALRKLRHPSRSRRLRPFLPALAGVTPLGDTIESYRVRTEQAARREQADNTLVPRKEA